MSAFREECTKVISQAGSVADLVAVVETFKHFGLSQVEAYCRLAGIYEELGCRDSEEDPQCEVIEDVLDRIWGFCEDAERLWDTTLSDREVSEFRRQNDQ